MVWQKRYGKLPRTRLGTHGDVSLVVKQSHERTNESAHDCRYEVHSLDLRMETVAYPGAFDPRAGMRYTRLSHYI